MMEALNEHQQTADISNIVKARADLDALLGQVEFSTNANVRLLAKHAAHVCGDRDDASEISGPLPETPKPMY